MPAGVLTLQKLSDLNALSANTANQLSRFIDFEVPQGQFFFIAPNKKHILRLAAYEVFNVTKGAGDTETTLSLTANPVQPPDKYLPTWPSTDGYTFKVFADLDDDGTYETRLTINSVDWANKQITVAFPAGWADGDTHNIRVSYIFGGGHLIVRRELPDNAAKKLSDTVLDTDTHDLGTRDQYSYGGVEFPVLVWLVEWCHLRWYIDAPVTVDLDPTLGATEIQIHYEMVPLSQAEAAYSARVNAPGRVAKYPNLYSALVAQMAGIEKQIPVGALGG